MRTIIHALADFSRLLRSGQIEIPEDAPLYIGNGEVGISSGTLLINGKVIEIDYKPEEQVIILKEE